MAISNSIGSNVFDILVGLGLPWTLQTLCIDYGSNVSASLAQPRETSTQIQQSRGKLVIFCAEQWGCLRSVLRTNTATQYLLGHCAVYHLTLTRYYVLIGLLITLHTIQWNLV